MVIFTPLPPQKNECGARAGRAGPGRATLGPPGILQRPLPSGVPYAPGSPGPKGSPAADIENRRGFPFRSSTDRPARCEGRGPGGRQAGGSAGPRRLGPAPRVRRAASTQAVGTGHFWSTGR